MDDSKHKYLVADDQVQSEDSSIEQPIEQATTSQTSVMIDQILAFIRPRLKQNIEHYSGLYQGPSYLRNQM